MFLSILIPNYGYSESTIRCLNSLTAQNKNGLFDFEILICDQSSKFEKNKLSCLLKANPIFKLISLDKPDVLNARKTLLCKAKGEYIFFIDSDDYIDPYFLDSVFLKLKEDKYPDLLITSYMVEENKKISKNEDLTFIDKTNFEKYFYCSDLINTLWRKIFKRSLFNEKEISNVHSTNGDDWIISYPVVKNAKVVSFDNTLCGYHYCINDLGLTHTMTIDRFKRTFTLKDAFPLFIQNFDETLIFKSKMTKFVSFCLISYRANKSENEIRDAFMFVRNNILFELKISRKAAKGFKHKVLYFALKHKMFQLFLNTIKKHAK